MANDIRCSSKWSRRMMQIMREDYVPMAYRVDNLKRFTRLDPETGRIETPVTVAKLFSSVFFAGLATRHACCLARYFAMPRPVERPSSDEREAVA